MKLTYRPDFLGAFTAYLVSLSIAIIYLSLNSWLGVGDLSPFLFWTCIPASAVFAIAFTVLKIPNTGLRYLIGFVLAFVIGVPFTVLGALSGGGSIFVWSFPVDLCWAIGAMAGTIVAVLTSLPRTWPIAVVLLTGTAVLAGAALLYELEPEPGVVIYTKTADRDEVQDVMNVLFGPPEGDLADL